MKEKVDWRTSNLKWRSNLTGQVSAQVLTVDDLHQSTRQSHDVRTVVFTDGHAGNRAVSLSVSVNATSNDIDVAPQVPGNPAWPPRDCQGLMTFDRVAVHPVQARSIERIRPQPDFAVLLAGILTAGDEPQ